MSNNNSNTNANTNTNNNTPGPTATSNDTASSTETTTRVPIAQTDPAGVLLITEPPQTATSFYKIAPNALITFAWSLSDVKASPASLTVSAVGDDGNTYAVGPTDGIIPGDASSVVWDVYSYQQAHPNTPLAAASYTLRIWDERGPDATRRPGYLQPNSALRFALYTPQDYTPLSSGS